VAELEAAGIERAVIQAEWASGDYRQDNDRVAALVRRHPDRFTGFAAVDELKRAVEELGLLGLNLQPFASGLHANHRKYYPLYLKCLEYGVPVTVHTGINYSSDRAMDYGRPLYLDDVACDFPGLVVVLNHGGWPWVAESVAIARKHPSLYLEIGGIAPKYLAMAGSGWEVFLRFADSLLQDRVLFATDSMIPVARAVAEARALPLKPEVLPKLMGENAARLLAETAAN
jgi:hypothetical protein